MHATVMRWTTPLAGAVCCALLYRIAVTRPLPGFGALSQAGGLETFSLLFISIILEALPFVLLGVILSAILQLFVNEQTVRRLLPQNPLGGIIFSCLLGIVLPVCECGMIPVVRGLMRKGMPAYMAAVFILCGPVLNPVVFASTYAAFPGFTGIAYARMGLAFAAAFTVGLILYRTMNSSPLRHSLTAMEPLHHHSDGNRISKTLDHASAEFFEMGKYLMLGAGITALVQTSLNPDVLTAIGQRGLSSQLFMAGFAYLLSLCSTSDAFVAATFSGQFSTGALLTFLVLGPMIDFKGTLMLLGVFKVRFVLVLSLLAAAAVITGAFFLGRLPVLISS